MLHFFRPDRICSKILPSFGICQGRSGVLESLSRFWRRRSSFQCPSWSIQSLRGGEAGQSPSGQLFRVDFVCYIYQASTHSFSACANDVFFQLIIDEGPSPQHITLHAVGHWPKRRHIESRLVLVRVQRIIWFSRVVGPLPDSGILVMVLPCARRFTSKCRTRGGKPSAQQRLGKAVA